MTIETYLNKSAENVVNKNIARLWTLNGYLKEGSGILHPTIKIQWSSKPIWNYCEIQDFGSGDGSRYYFMDGEPVNISNDIWEIKLRFDPLMSMRSFINNLTVIVERQENDFNPYIIDGEAPVEEKNQTFIISGSPTGKYWNGGNSFNPEDYGGSGGKHNVLLLSSSVCV